MKFGIPCAEIGFPEISRKLSREGAQVLLVPFAFGRERREIYEVATRARAIENGCFPRCGKPEWQVSFHGDGWKSRIVSPSGK